MGGGEQKQNTNQEKKKNKFMQFSQCWTARRSNQSILKEISPENSQEGLMLKLQYFGHLMRKLIGKDPDTGKD